MRMQKTVLLLFLFVAAALCLAGCAAPSEKPAKADAFVWLVGNWENCDTLTCLTENWQQQSETEFTGYGMLVKGKDTLFAEDLRLRFENNNWHYIPTVKNQNDGKPVRFGLKKSSPSEFVFENSTHDFPQQISYRQIGPDSMVAEISGEVKGQRRSETFAFRRKKNN